MGVYAYKQEVLRYNGTVQAGIYRIYGRQSGS